MTCQLSVMDREMSSVTASSNDGGGPSCMDKWRSSDAQEHAAAPIYFDLNTFWMLHEVQRHPCPAGMKVGQACSAGCSGNPWLTKTRQIGCLCGLVVCVCSAQWDSLPPSGQMIIQRRSIDLAPRHCLEGARLVGLLQLGAQAALQAMKPFRPGCWRRAIDFWSRRLATAVPSRCPH